MRMQYPQILVFQPNFFWTPQLFSSFQKFPKVSQEIPQGKNNQLFINRILEKSFQSDHTQSSKRRTWSVREDQKLLSILKKMNFSQEKRIPFHKVARKFQGRTSKQIRQRYLNHLKSQIDKSPFKKHQDQTILKYYIENGPKWKKLSITMKGRTPSSLKNRFNTKLKQTLNVCQSFFEQDDMQPTCKPKLFVQGSLDQIKMEDYH